MAAAGRALRRVGSPYAVDPGTCGPERASRTRCSRRSRRRGLPTAGPDRVEPRPRCRGRRGSRPTASPTAPAVDAGAARPGRGGRQARRPAVLGRATSTDYDEQRNDPGADATSRLSPYLKWGCLHPRQLLHKLGASSGRARLPLRAVLAGVLRRRPAPPAGDGSAGLRRPDGRHARSTAEAPPRRASTPGARAAPVTRSSTPGMRQLVAEGWMHNRVRMIVASFLVKDLHLDWTRGARHFMEHLVDGDLASNQHGWQWVAGTGTDAAPYFRIFNPVAQGERFDPRRHLRPPLGARACHRVGPLRPPPLGRPERSARRVSRADGRPRRGARGGVAALRGRPRPLRLSRGEPGGRPR